MPGIVLGAGDKAVNNTKIPVLVELTFQGNDFSKDMMEESI